MGWLEGDVALITGGASGLGLAIAKRFVSEGARVALFDKSSERLNDAIQDSGDHMIGIAGDVRSYADNKRAVQAVMTKFGRLDSFVGNAGIWDYSTCLLDLPEERIDAAFTELFEINVKGYLLGAKAAAPVLAENGGSIIFTLSNAAFHPAGGGPLYTATKHAGVGLIRQLAYELAPGIRVNGVAPAAVPSDLRGPAALGLESQSLAQVPLRDMVEGRLPIPFLPDASDYAGYYVLLASKANSRTMTGAVIEADCGFRVRGLKTKD